MKTDAELDEELRYKRGDRFIVERYISLQARGDEECSDFLSAGNKVVIVGYAHNEYRGIGYLVECEGIRYDRPLPRKCLERYMRPDMGETK